MKILVSGANGLVGAELSPLLENEGHTVVPLTRSRSEDQPNAVEWSPTEGKIEAEKLAGIDAVVHLAGENIAEGRWTEEKKKRIRDSRVLGTKLLAESIAKLDPSPRVMVSASAIGYYGDRGDDVMTEDSAAGDSFLCDVCKEWEDAAKPASDAGIRVVFPRIGVVLSPKGGALKTMLTPFKMGVGGKIGGGGQYMSWIALDDLASLLFECIKNDSLSGPINAVAPNAVTNKEFTKTLGRVLGRPTIFPMPGFAAKLLFGEMAKELLLASTRVQPKRLEDSAFAFKHSELEETLRFYLGKKVEG